MKKDLHARIASHALRQHGNVTRQQLLELGLDRGAIDYRLCNGLLHRVHVGVYAVGRPPSSPLERAAAAVLACGSEAVLSHGTALTLWGLSKGWRTPFHVTVLGDRRRPGITVHQASMARRDIRTRQGIRVTSPARTILDCASMLTLQKLSRAVSDAQIGGLARPDEIHATLQCYPRHRGAARLRALVAPDDGPTRSEFEDAFLEFCQQHGLPRPLVNVEVAGHEVDALFPAERVIVELDGWRFHQDRGAFERDRNRDADTLAAGFGTVRLTWGRMTRGPEAEALRLERILASRRGRSSRERQRPRRSRGQA